MGELKFNGSTVKKLKYLSNNVAKLQFNGVNIWENSYLIDYNANGHGTAPASQWKEVDESLILQPFIADESSTTTGTTISFDPNGGSSTPSPVSSVLTSTYSQSEWNTKEDGTGTAYGSEGTYSDNSDATLNAIWNLTHDYSPVIMPAGIEKSGSVFVKWNTKADGTGTDFSPSTSYDPDTYPVLLGDPILYARYGTPTTTTIKYVTDMTWGNYQQVTWDWVDNSYYDAYIYGNNDDDEISTSYSFSILCDGSWISLANAVSGGYVKTFRFYRYPGPVSQGDNVIHNSSVYNGGSAVFPFTNDPASYGCAMGIVTNLNKKVTGVRLSASWKDECSGYTVKQTTYV